jgi:protein-S-isoprenylcysteine O-methyltransferase Ste14
VQKASDTLIRLGGWLFRHRTSLPLPIAAAILTLRLGQAPPSAFLFLFGIAVTVTGEALRLWGVRHIGVISRTRSERLGPLVDTGPFRIIRNPLYVGNVLLWVGFAVTARLLWLAPVIIGLLGLQYHAIARWEEQVLEARVGDAYRAYAARVPRWLPLGSRAAGLNSETIQTWRSTLFSERGTLVAIALGYVLLWIKLKVLTF